jgi:hypothetical protein
VILVGTEFTSVTPFPRQTEPTLSTEPTISPQPTPFPLTPQPASAIGRDDCPAGWASYLVSSREFSLCYPETLSAGGQTGSISLQTPVIDQKPATDSPRIYVFASATTHRTFAEQVPLSEICKGPGLPGQVSGSEIEVPVGELIAQGCYFVGEVNSSDGPLESLQLSVLLTSAPTETPRFLNLIANWRTQSAEAETLVQQILRTIRVEE